VKNDKPVIPDRKANWQEMLEAQGKAELVEIVERNEAARLYLDTVFGD
jgi:hypothetical protein